MTQSSEAYRRALATAHDHALAWLDSLSSRPVPPREDAATIAAIQRALDAIDTR